MKRVISMLVLCVSLLVVTLPATAQHCGTLVVRKKGRVKAMHGRIYRRRHSRRIPAPSRTQPRANVPPVAGNEIELLHLLGRNNEGN